MHGLRRNVAVVAFAGVLAAASACAHSMAPVPVVATPAFPDFVQPSIPPALAGDPAAAAYERGWRFLQGGDFKNADRELSAALTQSPAFYPADAAAGYLDLARKDPKTALPHFDRVLAAQASYASALVGRGQALVALGRESEAIEAFDAAVAADPSLADIRRRAAVLTFQGAERDIAAAREAARAGRGDEAVRAYQQAIERSPNSAFLYRELAAVERENGEPDLELDNLRETVALDPTDAASFAEIGGLLDGRGDVPGALAAYDRSLALEPDEGVEAKRSAVRARADLARLPEEYRAIGSAPQITRADLAALIGVRLAPVLLTMRARGQTVMTDVRNNWAESWIISVVRAGVMDSFANHTFQPKAVVRRVDLVDALSRLLERIASPDEFGTWQNAHVKFSDLASTHLAYPAASAVVAAGVMTAADGAFQPSRPATGAEATAALDRLQALADKSAVARPSGPR